MIEKNSREFELLQEYAGGPALLAVAVDGLNAAQLDRSLAAESWSIRQIVHHLADGDEIWKTCILAALGGSKRVFDLRWYWDQSQDEWVIHWQYAKREIATSLARYTANRAAVVEMVSLTPGAWEKAVSMHGYRGGRKRITVGEVIAMQTRHLEGHLEEIAAIKEK